MLMRKCRRWAKALVMLVCLSELAWGAVLLFAGRV